MPTVVSNGAQRSSPDIAGLSKALQPNWNITVFAKIWKPFWIAVDIDGNAYVSQETLNHVVKVAPDGTKARVGSGFKNPFGVAVHHGNVYVADSGNGEVEEIAPNGKVTLIGSGWTSLRAVAVDSTGNIYVVAAGVYKVAPDGVKTKLLGFEHCRFPWAVAVDSARNVYATCPVRRLIFKITKNGVITHSYWLNPMGVAADDFGDIFVIRQNTGVFELTRNGQVVEIGSNFDFANPEGLSVRNGSVYVSSTGRNTIFKLTH